MVRQVQAPVVVVVVVGWPHGGVLVYGVNPLGPITADKALGHHVRDASHVLMSHVSVGNGHVALQRQFWLTCHGLKQARLLASHDPPELGRGALGVFPVLVVYERIFVAKSGGVHMLYWDLIGVDVAPFEGLGGVQRTHMDDIRVGVGVILQ